MRGLGQGLNSLIKNIEEPTGGESAVVKTELIKPNKFQPRRIFDPVKLAELSESIKENGLIQPIIVCKNSDTEYELIAGERRLEACKLAGIAEIPVFIKNVSDKERLVLAIVENVQRENLTPLEEAKAYKRLADEFELTHEEIAKIMGKDRVTITNTMRLLKLSDNVQVMLERKQITPGHARSILSVADELQEEFAQKIVDNKLSTQKAEEESKEYKERAPKEKPAPTKKTYEQSFLKSIESDIAGALQKVVKIKERKNEAGELIIAFKNKEELEDIISRIK